MQAILDICARWIVGTLLVGIGLAMLVGLFLLSRMPTPDIYHAAGVFIGVQAYSIVAFLFALVGLRYILGPRGWIDRMAEKSAGRVVGVAVLGSVIVGVLWLVAVL